MTSPNAWNVDDKSTFLRVDADGLRVNYIGPGKSDKDSAAIRANYPIPQQCELFYFEVKIIDKGKNGTGIGIGFCEETVNLNKMPGLENNSWGYYGDGSFFGCSESSKPYGQSFTTGDTIGCCLNFRYNKVFYTKNGVHLGIALRNLKGILYPCVGLWSKDGSVEINFCSKKFEYAAITDDDIDDVLLKEKWVEAFALCNGESQIDRLTDLIKLLEIDQRKKYRGKAYFIMGRCEEALADLVHLLEIEPNDPFALKYRGETYHMMRRYKESLADLNKLLEIKIDDEWALKAREEVIRESKYERRFLDERFLEDCDERFLDDTRFGDDENLRKFFLERFDDDEEFDLRERLEQQRNPDYGRCLHCNQYNSSWAWCQKCDPELTTQGWTSGNKDVDYCIREFQLKALTYTKVIEWIPFNRLAHIKEIGKGGFGSVFSATWLDGIRKINANNGNFTRTRKQSCKVALKTLPGSKANYFDFLKEFKNHMQCRSMGSGLKIYGLTQDTETKEYLMVFQYANSGNLHKFLESNFSRLTWQSKLRQLTYISYDLVRIHKAGYVHGDFHSGNILQNQSISKKTQTYITDLGLSRKKDERALEKCIYGVMPYVAPEVLLGQQYTPSADIYGLGVIMSEMSIGKRPFDGYPFDLHLALDICKGLRPGFAPKTPNCYIELAKQCMDSNTQKRPTAKDVNLKLNQWRLILETEYLADEEQINIKKEFLAADEMIKSLSANLSKHPNSMYSSKMINTQEIKSRINNNLCLFDDSKQIDFTIPNVQDSKQIDFTIPNDENSE